MIGNVSWRRSAFSLAMIAATTLLPVPAVDLSERTTERLGDELGIPLYAFMPHNSPDPKAVVLAIHGATLHGRSFAHPGEQLSGKGFAVFAADMRGFGAWYHNAASEQSKHIRYRWSEADLRRLLAKLRDLYPAKHIFIIGESTGANMALRLLKADPQCADGAVLSSPSLKQRFIFGPTVFKHLGTILIAPRAQLDLSPFLRTRISESRLITAERLNDPLARNHMNVGELFKTRWFNKESLQSLALFPPQLPVLVLTGAKDRLFDPNEVHRFMSQLPSQDKELRWLKGKGHINLETGHLDPEVLSAVCQWLERQSSRPHRLQPDIQAKCTVH